MPLNKKAGSYLLSAFAPLTTEFCSTSAAKLAFYAAESYYQPAHKLITGFCSSRESICSPVLERESLTTSPLNKKAGSYLLSAFAPLTTEFCSTCAAKLAFYAAASYYQPAHKLITGFCSSRES
ncbi:MAG: hypothetical protein J6X84_02735, partial [Treponema sp.]|nr:hypothetical protein [Treponema sp.]